MTGKTVADGKKQSGLPNELRGQLSRKLDELKRRLNEGTLDFQRTMNRLQLLIEDKPDKFRLVTDLGIVTHPDGRRFRVEVYGHIREDMTTSSDERLAFLASRGATLLGQLGLELLESQELIKELPRGFWYFSFEAGNCTSVPGLDARSGGGGRANLGYFEFDWDADDRLLCFVEVKE